MPFVAALKTWPRGKWKLMNLLGLDASMELIVVEIDDKNIK